MNIKQIKSYNSPTQVNKKSKRCFMRLWTSVKTKNRLKPVYEKNHPLK